MMWIATFRRHTASLQQSSNLLIEQDAPLWFVGFPTAVIDAFRSSMFVSCSLDAPLSYGSPVVFFDLGHPRFISIPLFLLMLLGWRLMRIASLTLRVYQWGSRSINSTLSQSGRCPVLWACSGTAEVWVWASWTSRSCSFILSCIGLPAEVNFAAFTGNPVNYDVYFSQIDSVFHSY